MDILAQIKSGQVLIVAPHRRSGLIGLILHKRYHSEFAGPGAAVGGTFDQDCQQVELVGNAEVYPANSVSFEERQRAYAIRRQWLRLTLQDIEEIEQQG